MCMKYDLKDLLFICTCIHVHNLPENNEQVTACIHLFVFFTELYIAIPCRRWLQAKMPRTTLALQVPSRVHWTVWQFDIGFTWCFPLLLTRWAAQAVRMHPTCHIIDGIHDSGVPAAAIPAREIHADVAGASVIYLNESLVFFFARTCSYASCCRCWKQWAGYCMHRCCSFYRIVHCNSMQTLASGDDAKNHVGIAGAM